MIQIKPKIAAAYKCFECGFKLKNEKVLWQGIHVCSETKCMKCGSEFIIDLPVGHAFFEPYAVNKKTWKIVGKKGPSYLWFGKTLEDSLANPNRVKIDFKIERFKKSKNVVILNCIDYLYGHSLLKLLNTEKLLRKSGKVGVVVIIPNFLRWMVPTGVSEIWQVGIPLKKAQGFYTSFNTQIKAQLNRFEKVYLSRAYSHPKEFNISSFTRVPTHDFKKKEYRITFIWREDRPWIKSEIIVYLSKKLKIINFLLIVQNFKIVNLFRSLRRVLPNVRFTVAGFGKNTIFPFWIDDLRVKEFTSRLEKLQCKVYSQSRVVLGVHGSSMLLPSAHAGMSVDLVPDTRITNIAEDVLYAKSLGDPREVSFKYRYFPIDISSSSLSLHLLAMARDYEKSLKYFIS